MGEDSLNPITARHGYSRSPSPPAGLHQEANLSLLAASNYPFLNIFWTILIFFAWVVWIWIAITVLIDVFRRRDISGWGKAAWVIFVIVLPFLGVLTYLIFNHDGMADRSGKEAAASQAQLHDYCARPPAWAVRPARSRRPRRCSTAA